MKTKSNKEEKTSLCNGIMKTKSSKEEKHHYERYNEEKVKQGRKNITM